MTYTISVLTYMAFNAFYLLSSASGTDDSECPLSQKCTALHSCPWFQEKKQELNSFNRGTEEYNKIRDLLRKSICNRKAKKVCCRTESCGSMQDQEDCKCNGQTECIYKEDCPQYKLIEHIPQTHPDYQNLTDKWSGRICDFEKRRLRCPTCSGSYLPKPGQCGKRYLDVAQIISGENAELGEFPWAVLLGYKVRKKKFDPLTSNFTVKEVTQYKCGGTLINTRYVLTAAHCNARGSKISEVVLGEFEVGVDPDCPSYSQDPRLCQPKRQVIEVESIKMHEDFTGTNNQINRQTGKILVNDIALVRLKTEAILNIAVQPICLPLNEKETARDIEADDLMKGIIGRKVTVVGWGQTYNYQGINPQTGVVENILQKVDIPITSNKDCQSKLSGLTNPGVDLFVGPEAICAGGRDSTDSCKGDSGGGMFINKNWWAHNLTHIYYITHYQIGIVSYGSPTCGIGSPAVYTRVSQFIPWIRQNIFD